MGKETNHRKQWFLSRQGQKIYRLPLNPNYGHKCVCDMCLGSEVLINDEQHALCLYDHQNEEGITYQDRKIIYEKK